jgi:SET domain-containing protein
LSKSEVETTAKADDKFLVKRTTIGLGLFAAKPIRAEKRFIEYIGPVISNEESDKKGGKYLFRVDDRRVIDGSARSNLARYINHSCDPNAEAFSSSRGRVWIWSKREIEAGEAITLHYGEEYFNQHIKPIGCKCEKCLAKRSPKKRVRESK